MPGPNLPEVEIRSRARHAIDEDRLPVMLVRNVNGSFGFGEPCWVCREKITTSQIEYEVAVGKRLMLFHLICYAEWQLECAQRTREREQPQRQ